MNYEAIKGNTADLVTGRRNKVMWGKLTEE